jgi:hypothetical protein
MGLKFFQDKRVWYIKYFEEIILILQSHEEFYKKCLISRRHEVVEQNICSIVLEKLLKYNYWNSLTIKKA